VTKIYLGNIPFSATEESIRNFFAPVTPLQKVSICTDRETDRPRGFAFVEIADAEAARRAISELNGTNMGGRAAVVSEAYEKTRGAPRQDSRSPSPPPQDDRRNKGGGGGRGRRGGRGSDDGGEFWGK
jgi:RNA recognition motif-containing protein